MCEKCIGVAKTTEATLNASRANGVSLTVMPAAEFAGEHSRPGPLYLCALWSVSLWAMVTNSAQVLYRFLKVDKTPIWNAVRNGDMKKAVKRFLVAWMTLQWEMGRDPKHISSTFVDRFSEFNHVAKYGAAGWRSLDVFYNCHQKVFSACGNTLSGKLTKFWIGRMENRQAVTNRLKMVIELLALALHRFLNESEVRILSVASGSAQAVIGAIKKSPGLNIKVALIDADESAINEAKRLVAEAGLQDRFQFFHGSTTLLEEVAKDFRPHIVEMVGFLDYRPEKKAIELIGRIRSVLPTGGIFLTCNIRRNLEKIFLDWVLLWPMIYRNEYELADVLTCGGFQPKNIDLIYEPFRIHGIAVCRK